MDPNHDSEDEFWEFLDQCLMESEPADANQGTKDHYLNRLVHYLKALKEPVRLLDYGCGRGRFCFALSRLTEQQRDLISYVGVDLESEHLDTANKSAKESGLYKCQFLSSHDFWNQTGPDLMTFDVILCANTLHEVGPSMVGPLITSLCHRIMEEGRLFIQDMAHLPKGEKHFVCFTGNEMAMILSPLPSLEVKVFESVSQKAKIPVWLVDIKRVDDFASYEAAAMVFMMDDVLEAKRQSLLKELDGLEPPSGGKKLASLLTQQFTLLSDLSHYYFSRNQSMLGPFGIAPLFCPFCLKDDVYVGSRFDIEWEDSILWLWCNRKGCSFGLAEDEKWKVLEICGIKEQ